MSTARLATAEFDRKAYLNRLPSRIKKGLVSGSHSRRLSALAGLQELAEASDPDTVSLLIGFLDDDHPKVRAAAGELVSWSEEEQAVPQLLSALRGAESGKAPGRRASLIHALSLFPLETATQDLYLAVCETLLDCLTSADTDVRFQALASLNRLGFHSDRYRSVVPNLIEDPDEEVAAVAAIAAADLGLTELVDRIVSRWQKASGFAGRQFGLAAAHLGSHAVIRGLEKTIREGSAAVEAIEALVLLSGAEAECALNAAQRSWRVHPLLRARAAVGLAQLNWTDGDPAVLGFLRHKRPEVRQATLDWLVDVGLHQAIGHMVALAESDERGMREPACEALLSLDGTEARAAANELSDRGGSINALLNRLSKERAVKQTRSE